MILLGLINSNRCTGSAFTSHIWNVLWTSTLTRRRVISCAITLPDLRAWCNLRPSYRASPRSGLASHPSQASSPQLHLGLLDSTSCSTSPLFTARPSSPLRRGGALLLCNDVLPAQVCSPNLSGPSHSLPSAPDSNSHSPKEQDG